MALYKTTGIVLHSYPYREADVILTVYTPAHGKVKALAKGARKPKSRLRGGVQPLTQSSFALYAGRTLDTVTQCQLEAAFPNLHADLQRWAYANYVAELVLALVVGTEGNKDLFALLLTTLYLLEDKEPALVTRFFETRILALLGYSPELSRCGVCGGPLEGRVWQVGGEGLVCQACAASHAAGGHIGRSARAALYYFLRVRPSAVGRLRLGRDVLAELRLALNCWLSPHLDRPLKSAGFLQGLGQQREFFRG